MSDISTVTLFSRAKIWSKQQCCSSILFSINIDVNQIFFDLFIPLTCALLLIYGAKRKSSCLLLIWFIIVFISYVQYLVVVFESNWDKASVIDVVSFFSF